MSGTEVNTEVQFENTDDLDAFATDFFGEKTQAEPAAKQEDAVEETADTANQDDETDKTAEVTDDQTVDPNEDPDAEFKEAPPKKKTVQDRIDELVRQREDAKREAAAEIVRLREEFEAKLQALKPAQKTQTASEPTPDDTNDKGEQKYPLGEFDPAYIRDLTRFTLEQERAQATIRAEEQRQKNEQAAQSAALQSSWNEKLEAAKTKYPDLTQKGQELLNGFNDLNQDYAGYLATVLMSMDYGPDVLNYLSSNPTEARTIVNSGAQKATLALGRIEAKFAEAEAQKLVAKPKISNAPPPPAASARGTGGGAKTVEPDTDDLDAFTQEFFRKRR